MIDDYNNFGFNKIKNYTIYLHQKITCIFKNQIEKLLIEKKCEVKKENNKTN